MNHAQTLPKPAALRNGLLCLLLLAAGAARAAAPLPPAAIAGAAAYSASHGGAALLILQSGQTLLATGQTGVAHRIYSGTKAFWILAALCAAEDGLLRLDEKAAETLPEWRTDSRKSTITIGQLLNFTAGLDPQFRLHENAFPDRNRAALDGAAVAAPGRSFIYGPAALQVFSEILRRKLEPRETPIHYLERKVLKPLGLGPQRYLLDKAGHPLLASGFLLTAEQWSRLGQLVLREGRPVVSAASLERCFRGSAANGAFGMAFWNNRGSTARDMEAMLSRKWHEQDWRDACLAPEAPRDLVACIGSGYQRQYMIPSRDLVIVRFGNGARFSDAEFLRLLFR